MKIRIEIATDNAAFADAPSTEVARILRKLADQYEQNMAIDFGVTLFDVNGNRVGEATWDAPVGEEDDEPSENCAHEWVHTGTAYGGDDSRWHGEGRVYCAKCGADGDG
jgi:hypothetical protein